MTNHDHYRGLRLHPELLRRLGEGAMTHSSVKEALLAFLARDRNGNGEPTENEQLLAREAWCRLDRNQLHQSAPRKRREEVSRVIGTLLGDQSLLLDADETARFEDLAWSCFDPVHIAEIRSLARRELERELASPHAG